MGALSELTNRIQRGYAGRAERPLRGYLAVLGAYGALAGSVAAVARGHGVRLPERFGPGDTVLLAIATFKASRLLSKDAVTSPVRAPFARFEEPAGASELNESVRGHGVRHAAGELLTCPFCLAVWLGSALTTGLVLAPRPTRFACTLLTAVAGADGLQLGYDLVKQRTEGS